jgi:hypothetical protein
MSVLDSELLFGEAIDIGSTSASASVSGTNVIYLPKVKNHKGSSVNQQPNNSGRLYLNMVVEDEALGTASGSAVVTCRLYAHTAAASYVSGDQIIEKAITVAAVASTAYGDGVQIMSHPLPAGDIKPYLGINFAVATKKVTQGKITAWIGPMHTQVGV